MLSFWEQEMQKSGRSLEERRATAKTLSGDSSAISQDLTVYCLTLNDRWRELEELSFATGLPLSSPIPTQDWDTFSKEMNLG